MYFVGSAIELLTLLELLNDVWVASCCGKSREPVQARNDAVLDFASRDMTRPTDHGRHAEAAFEPRSLAACKRSLTTIGPGEVLGSVVGAKYDYCVGVQAIVLHVLHDRANDVVELRHTGFLDRPAVFWCAHLLVLFRQMCDDMHPGRVKPEEERLSVLSCLVGELKRVTKDFVIDGLHSIWTQGTGVLDPLPADLTPSRLFRGIVHIRGPAMYHVARSRRRLG